MSRNAAILTLAAVVLLSFVSSFSVAYGAGPKPSTTRWSGYLIDLACARERKDVEPDLGPQHTKKCMLMPACNRNGFGLLTDANELLPFDENSNSKVRTLLRRTNQSGDLRVVVQGTMANDILQIRKIELKKR